LSVKREALWLCSLRNWDALLQRIELTVIAYLRTRNYSGESAGLSGGALLTLRRTELGAAETRGEGRPDSMETPPSGGEVSLK
jgi:hypothetical protein